MLNPSEVHPSIGGCNHLSVKLVNTSRWGTIPIMLNKGCRDLLDILGPKISRPTSLN